MITDNTLNDVKDYVEALLSSAREPILFGPIQVYLQNLEEPVKEGLREDIYCGNWNGIYSDITKKLLNDESDYDSLFNQLRE